MRVKARNEWTAIADPRAASGFNDPRAYDRGRPSFPRHALARIVSELELEKTSRVLDLAAGTGKLSGLLVELVGQVVAVDPSRAMLAVLAERLPECKTRLGSAEAIPLADGSVDAVFVAEAFHWFRTAEASHEIVRVLRSNGHLVLVWQRPNWDRADLPWLDEFDRLMEPLFAASERLAGPHPNLDKRWKSELAALELFDRPSSFEVDFVHRLGREDFVALVSSWSWIAILPAEQRKSVLTSVRELVAGRGPLTLRYRTEIQWTRPRRPDES